jgi:succinyl-diaminopimelate desuccinylase
MTDREVKISQAELLGLLRDLIRNPSPNPPGDIRACTAIVAAVLSREGIGFRIDESKAGITNLIAELDGSLGAGSKGPTLLFNGHLDTVPPGGAWQADPYDPIERDGYVEGRGSVDMKGGIAASLMALVSLKRSGCPFRGKILYTAVGDEEFHSQFGTKYLIAKGLGADFAVCCEPTDLELELGNRGLLMIDVLVKGKASHAGRPSLGVNAVHRAAKIVEAVERLAFDRFRNPAFEVPTASCSVVHICGGERLNVVPDRCSLFLDRRLMPGESGTDAVREIAEMVERTLGIAPDVGADRGGEVVLQPEFWHEPCWTPEQSPIAASACKVIEQIIGRPPVIRGKAAGTDASHLVSQAGIPTIILGPGDFRLSHTAQERVKAADVWKAVAVYQALALELLKA